MPKAVSSPSISDEQRERMLKNKKMAEERRLAKLNASKQTVNNSSAEVTSANNSKDVTVNLSDDDEENSRDISKMRNRKAIISSDESEDETEVNNQSVVVDIHGNGTKDLENERTVENLLNIKENHIEPRNNDEIEMDYDNENDISVDNQIKKADSGIQNDENLEIKTIHDNLSEENNENINGLDKEVLNSETIRDNCEVMEANYDIANDNIKET